MKPRKGSRGFTLIELLAVIIILGVLMIIAIPQVTKYINESRESAYVNTAKSIVNGVRTLVYSGDIDVSDRNTTYYIPASYVLVDNGTKSPYGEFTEAYVAVISNEDGHNYYWISVDEAGMGVKDITGINNLGVNDIESGIVENDITLKISKTGIGNRSRIVKLNTNTNSWEEVSNSALIKAAEDIVCKKATELHEVICKNNTGESGCSLDIGYNNKIIYGTIPDGMPKPGDAYDCKVRKDGGYTERFYYVTNNGDNAVLIYYTSVNGQEKHEYDLSAENWHGPRDGYQVLPSTSEWDNLYGIIPPGERQIKNELGGNTTYNNRNEIVVFSYEGKAARFLTYQEVIASCGSGNETESGYLDKCNYLLENLYRYEREKNGSYTYLLENPYSGNVYSSWTVDGYGKDLFRTDVRGSAYGGVRAAIEVHMSGIEK